MDGGSVRQEVAGRVGAVGNESEDLGDEALLHAGLELGVELCEARLASVVEDEDRVYHGVVVCLCLCLCRCRCRCRYLSPCLCLGPVPVPVPVPLQVQLQAHVHVQVECGKGPCVLYDVMAYPYYYQVAIDWQRAPPAPAPAPPASCTPHSLTPALHITQDASTPRPPRRQAAPSQ